MMKNTIKRIAIFLINLLLINQIFAVEIDTCQQGEWPPSAKTAHLPAIQKRHKKMSENCQTTANAGRRQLLLHLAGL